MICVVQIHVFRLKKEKQCLTSKVDLTDVAICEPPVENVRWLVGFGFMALRNSIPVHKVRRLPKNNVGRPFETVFQSISGRLPEKKKEERNDGRE